MPSLVLLDDRSYTDFTLRHLPHRPGLIVVLADPDDGTFLPPGRSHRRRGRHPGKHQPQLAAPAPARRHQLPLHPLRSNPRHRPRRPSQPANIMIVLQTASYIRQRRFEGEAAHAIDALGRLHLDVWEYHRPRLSPQTEVNGLADDEVDEILESASQLAEAGLHLASGLLDSQQTDARAVAYLDEQEVLPPADLERWLEDVEAVADVTLPRARARLSVLINDAQSAGTPAPPWAATGPSRPLPLPGRLGAPSPEPPDSVAALFRSLAEPGSE